MTDENLRQLRKDIDSLLSREYGSSYEIITYEPRQNITTGIFGITLTVEVKTAEGVKRAHTRKASNLKVIEAIKKQINEHYSIIDRHYL